MTTKRCTCPRSILGGVMSGGHTPDCALSRPADETTKRPDRMTPEEKARADGYAAGVLGERDHTTRALTEVAALRARLEKAEEERNALRAEAATRPVCVCCSGVTISARCAK